MSSAEAFDLLEIFCKFKKQSFPLTCLQVPGANVPFYGSSASNEVRNSGRSHQETSVAQIAVEQIRVSLIMGAYSRNSNFGLPNYSRYNNVPQNLQAFNCSSQQVSAVPSKRGYSTALMPSSIISEDSVYTFFLLILLKLIMLRTLFR